MSYFSKNGLNFIKAHPNDIYAQVIKNNLHSIGATGINGTLYDGNGTVMILISRGKVLGRNGMYNGWNQPRRPVLYYTTKGHLKLEKVQNTNQLTTPVKNIKWAVGGGSLTPVDLSGERWGSDVTRAGARRTGIATLDGYVYLITSNSGMSLKTFSGRIYQSLGSNVQATFLDGGGSTQMMYKGKSIVRSTRRVDNGIFVVDK